MLWPTARDGWSFNRFAGSRRRGVEVEFKRVFAGERKVEWTGWTGAGLSWEFCFRLVGVFWDDEQPARKVTCAPTGCEILCCPRDPGVTCRVRFVYAHSDRLGYSACPLKLQKELEDLLQFRLCFLTVLHCYREANSPADRLVNYGVDSGAGQVFTTFADLP